MWLWTNHPTLSDWDSAVRTRAGDETAAALTPGSVLRVHLGTGVSCDVAARAVAATVRRARAQGYRFVRIDEPVVDPAA